MPLSAGGFRPLPMFLIALLLLQPLSVLSPGGLRAEEPCGENRLFDARRHYELGRFQETIRTLRPCMPDGFDNLRDRVRANHLMAVSFIATDYPDSARVYVKAILKINPRYQADLDDGDPQLLAEMLETERPSRRKWLWGLAGGALVGAGVLTYIVIDNATDKPGQLPDPPAFP